ncbi:MAG: 50S ribosome-binding GTPase [Bacteroidaceae bacterium]|nr:50S ribosome-binding GTPase [Bacteroidaceae bacterium]
MIEDSLKLNKTSGDISDLKRYVTACGHVKVLFLGASNSGKTTLINGLMGNDLLPECMHTSTKITTYIGGTIDNEDCIYLFDSGSNMNPRILKSEEFVRFSSYKLEEVYSAKKSRESTMTAIIPFKHVLSDSDICITDTIGFGINHFDSEATIKAIDEADIIVIVYDASHTGGFTLDELEFLNKYIFKREDSVFPMDRIIIVPNKIDKVPSVYEVEKIIKTDLCNLVRRNTQEFKVLSNSICPISAYYYRLARVGISNHVIAGDRKVRNELMNYDAEMLIRAGLATGNYKQHLYEESQVEKLIALLRNKARIYKGMNPNQE